MQTCNFVFGSLQNAFKLVHQLRPTSGRAEPHRQRPEGLSTNKFSPVYCSGSNHIIIRIETGCHCLFLPCLHSDPGGKTSPSLFAVSIRPRVCSFVHHGWRDGIYHSSSDCFIRCKQAQTLGRTMAGRSALDNEFRVCGNVFWARRAVPTNQPHLERGDVRDKPRCHMCTFCNRHELSYHISSCGIERS